VEEIREKVRGLYGHTCRQIREMGTGNRMARLKRLNAFLKNAAPRMSAKAIITPLIADCGAALKSASYNREPLVSANLLSAFSCYGVLVVQL